jgi:hypothetical protein
VVNVVIEHPAKLVNGRGDGTYHLPSRSTRSAGTVAESCCCILFFLVELVVGREARCRSERDRRVISPMVVPSVTCTGIAKALWARSFIRCGWAYRYSTRTGTRGECETRGHGRRRSDTVPRKRASHIGRCSTLGRWRIRRCDMSVDLVNNLSEKSKESVKQR